MRRLLCIVGLASLTLALPIHAKQGGVGSARLQLVEAQIEDLLKAQQTGLATSEEIVERYLARIAAYELALQLTPNPAKAVTI